MPDLDSQIAQASAHLQELLAKKSPAQLDRAAVKSMTPDQIEQARVDGRLNDLLGIK